MKPSRQHWVGGPGGSAQADHRPPSVTATAAAAAVAVAAAAAVPPARC